MQDRIASRLDTLREEYRTGQAMHAELEGRQAELRQTLLRISGAIQVLEELLAGAKPGEATLLAPDTDVNLAHATD